MTKKPMEQKMKYGLLLVTTILIAGGTSVSAKDRGEGMFDFSTIDADGNGEITQAEVTAFETSRFAEADTNSDGLLSQDEILASFEARSGRELGDRASQRIERMITRLDANEDGSVSLEEQQASERARRIFDRLDSDDSGTISQAEAEKVKERGKRRGKGKDRAGRDRGNDRS